MSLVSSIAVSLVAIYVSAIVLALRDRVCPQPERVPSTPVFWQNPSHRKYAVYLLPVLIPIWVFALAIWLVVYLPVFVWRWLRCL